MPHSHTQSPVKREMLCDGSFAPRKHVCVSSFDDSFTVPDSESPPSRTPQGLSASPVTADSPRLDIRFRDTLGQCRLAFAEFGAQQNQKNILNPLGFDVP